MGGLIENLEKIGLTPNEADIYLTITKLGRSKASEIGKIANVKREAIYYTLSLLENKGLVLITEENNVKYFSTITIEKFIEKTKMEYFQKEQILNNIKEDVENMRGKTVKLPIAEVFREKQGIQRLVNLVSNHKDKDIISVISNKIVKENMNFSNIFTRKRVENNLRLKTILDNVPFFEKSKEDNNNKIRDVKFCKKFEGLEVIFYLVEDEIYLGKIKDDETYGIYIKDKEFAKLIKIFYETFWNSLKN